MKTAIATPAILRTVTSQNWAEGLVLPPAAAARIQSEIDGTRLDVLVNDQHRMRCALIKVGGEHFLYLSQEKRRAWDIHPGDTVDLLIQADKSRYGIELPEEWAEMMSLDPETDRRFHALSPGVQRNLLHRIGSAKRVETRVRRAVLIADYLRDHGEAFDYQELAAYTKQWNREHA